MEELFGFFKALGFVAGICVFILVIMGFIMTIINKITYKKRLKKAKEEFKNDLATLRDLLVVINEQNKENAKDETKPKCKNCKNCKNDKKDK